MTLMPEPHGFGLNKVHARPDCNVRAQKARDAKKKKRKPEVDATVTPRKTTKGPKLGPRFEGDHNWDPASEGVQNQATVESNHALNN